MSTPELIQCIKDKLDGKKSKNTPSFEEYSKKLVEEFLSKGEAGNASWIKYGANFLIKYSQLKNVQFYDITPDLLRQIEAMYLHQKIEEHRKKNTSKPLSKNGINNYMRAIRRIINRAVDSGFMQESDNPFKRYKIPKSKTQPRPVADVEDFRKIIDVKLDESSKEYIYHKIWLFLFYARGMNMADAAKIKVRDVSMKSHYYSYSRSKTGQIITIKIDPEMREIINYFAKGKNQDNYLLPIIMHENPDPIRIRKDVKNATKQLNKYMNRVSEKLGIEMNLTSYVSRYTFGTYARKAGIEMDVIQELLGQESPESTKAYVNPHTDETMDGKTRQVIDYTKPKHDESSQKQE